MVFVSTCASATLSLTCTGVGELQADGSYRAPQRQEGLVRQTELEFLEEGIKLGGRMIYKKSSISMDVYWKNISES